MLKIGSLWGIRLRLTGCVALTVAALASGGCGDDKAASADSSASATTDSTATTQASAGTQPAKVLEQSSDYDQQLKTVPPSDSARRAALKSAGAKPAAVKSPKLAAVKSSQPGAKPGGDASSGTATVSDLETFGNALIKANAHPHVSITTNRGTFVVEVDPQGVPIGAANFVSLAAHHFYDNLTFHRVEPGFVIQGGDPQGTGQGGPGYNIPDEMSPLLHEAGVVAWAKAGPNTAGSQFYVTLAPAHPLDHQYTVFGKIIKGMDVVQATQIGDVMKKVVVTGVPPKLKVPNLVKK